MVSHKATVPANCLRVMVVDNDPDTVYSIKLALQLKGLLVDAFDSAYESLAAYDPNVHFVALVDLRMKEMSGFELAREIWDINPNMQVCFLTGFQINSSESKKLLPGLKNHCFLKKPIDIGVLAAHILAHRSNMKGSAVSSDLMMSGDSLLPCMD